SAAASVTAAGPAAATSLADGSGGGRGAAWGAGRGPWPWSAACGLCTGCSARPKAARLRAKVSAARARRGPGWSTLRRIGRNGRWLRPYPSMGFAEAEPIMERTHRELGILLVDQAGHFDLSGADGFDVDPFVGKQS